MNFKDEKEQKLVMCSLNEKIEKEKVPTTGKLFISCYHQLKPIFFTSKLVKFGFMVLLKYSLTTMNNNFVCAISWMLALPSSVIEILYVLIAEKIKRTFNVDSSHISATEG